MGKVLRVLVILILVMGLFAAYLAWANFSKREVLIGRTHAMEEAFIKLARTIEADDPPEVPQPAYPQRDLSPVTSREVENPERSAFWDSYNHKFEPTVQPIPTLDFSSNEKRRQLREFYRIDPATGKPAIDSFTGKPDTKGAGTLDELLSTVFDRAKSQYALLNQTRAELPKLRTELVDVVEDLNSQKQAGRADKRSIEEKDVQIATLGREKREIEERNARLDEEMRGLRTELQEANDVIARNEDDIKLLNDTIKKKDEIIASLKGPPGTVLPPGERLQGNGEGQFTPGVHGKVVSLNEEWKFVVIEFSDAFMAQLQGADGKQPMPQLEMMVKRPGFAGVAGEFVTRVRLRQIIRDQNLVVADILTDWQQAPLELGDAVFF